MHGRIVLRRSQALKNLVILILRECRNSKQIPERESLLFDNIDDLFRNK